MVKVAIWIGWRSPEIQAAVIARAVGLALFSGDPATSDRYLDKIADLIGHFERNPLLGTRSVKVPSCRYFPISSPAPGNPDTLIYNYDEAAKTLVGEGTYPFLPPIYK